MIAAAHALALGCAVGAGLLLGAGPLSALLTSEASRAAVAPLSAEYVRVRALSAPAMLLQMVRLVPTLIPITSSRF